MKAKLEAVHTWADAMSMFIAAAMVATGMRKKLAGRLVSPTSAPLKVSR